MHLSSICINYTEFILISVHWRFYMNNFKKFLLSFEKRKEVRFCQKNSFWSLYYFFIWLKFFDWRGALIRISFIKEFPFYFCQFFFVSKVWESLFPSFLESFFEVFFFSISYCFQEERTPCMILKEKEKRTCQW